MWGQIQSDTTNRMITMTSNLYFVVFSQWNIWNVNTISDWFTFVPFNILKILCSQILKLCFFKSFYLNEEEKTSKISIFAEESKFFLSDWICHKKSTSQNVVIHHLVVVDGRFPEKTEFWMKNVTTYKLQVTSYKLRIVRYELKVKS